MQKKMELGGGKKVGQLEVEEKVKRKYKTRR